MPEILSLYSPKNRYHTDPGSREANDYEVRLDKKGHKTLHFVGTHDIYQEIQSYAEECKIENILARAAAGDVNALNQRQGIYADITNTPENLAEAQNIILKLSAEFEKLPAEVREKFDNSKEKFVNDFGSESWNEAMGLKTIDNKAEKITFDGKEAAEVLTPEANKTPEGNNE